MSNKLAFILSIYIIMMTFLFGTDLVMLQVNYSNLDSLSQLISFKISDYGIDENGDIDSTIIEFAKNNLNADLIRADESSKQYKEGDLYPYFLFKEYDAIMLSITPIKVQIKRYAVIGINHT